MREPADPERTVVRQAVLYADVSGSTRLYERWGDTTARHDIRVCLDVLAQVATRLRGRVVKTIGDEIMCAFPGAVPAATAAGQMHEALREACAAGRFRTGTLRVKIGWHFGEVEPRRDDLAGPAATIAQQVIRLAKPEEILTTGTDIALLPENLRRPARLVTRVETERDGPIEVWAQPWEASDEVTQMGTSVVPAVPAATHAALLLDIGGRTYTLDEDHPLLRIGRAEENHVRIAGRSASRLHAELSFRHGRFHLRDHSYNGTVVVTADGHTRLLHNEEGLLEGAGRLGFGSAPDSAPDATAAFRGSDAP